MDEVKDLRHTHIGHCLVHDLLDLYRSHTDRERRANHDAVLSERLGSNEGRKLDHQPGPHVQTAMKKDLVEGEIIEGFDELRVGYRQGGDVSGKQLVMVLLRSLIGFHGCFSFNSGLPGR